MFREGGWAVPLNCDSPTLKAWLGHLQWACSVLGIPCDTYVNPEYGYCPGKWSPLTITGTAALAACLLLLFLTVATKNFIRWHSSRRGSTMAALATAAAAELRKASPNLYPPAPHCWFRLDGDQLRAPLLCAVCHGLIQADGEVKRVNCCEVCGVVCHEGCVRKVPHDCRPAAEAGDRMLHLWKPAGVVMYDSEEELSEAAMQMCLYCQEPCEPDVFASEPTWSCSWCRACAHVTCYHEFHKNQQAVPDVGTEVATAAADAKRQRANSHAEAGPLNGSPGGSSSSIVNSVGEPVNGLRRNGRRQRRHKSLLGGNGTTLVGVDMSSPSFRGLHRAQSDAARRVNSIGAFLNTLAAAVSGMPDLEHELEEVGTHFKPRTPAQVDVHALDTCHFGPHRRLVLPPTAVRLIPADSWSDRAKHFLRSATAKKRRKGGSKAAQDSDGQQPTGMGGTQRVASWWGEAQVPWSSYRIGKVPPGLKPLLVFLNTRSGPQSGTRLRRRLLRMLNPIQVVELPKEKPEEALELFAGVPNLQVLVMGGDGTVAWILNCLDALQERMVAQADTAHWTPPPVAVLPLGTGNDLARVLNWGGGLYALKQRGLAAVLHDIEHSIVALLDRWNVRIEAAPPPSSPMSPVLHRMGSLSHAEPPKGTCKVMNNYMGIGVDAKAALDFHSLREQYPSWFCSQMGNKLWYTTVGAKDILGHTSRGLTRKLQVVCDGKLLELPDDIEGLLLLNINSYMGGVDLWASGAAQPSHDPAKQSFCDGRLELVAVYGSWHLGQLQVGLSRAIRLTQCSTCHITTHEQLPMQIDGEPWKQPPATLQVDLKGKAFMLRRTESEPLARMAQVVADTLEEMCSKGIISPAQRQAVTTEIATRLHPVL